MNKNFTLRIQNFKNFENLELEVRPITFLFGANNSGKSSVLKSLKFFESNLFPSLRIEETFYKCMEDMDLGSFREIVRNNCLDTTVSIEIRYHSDVKLRKHLFEDICSESPLSPLVLKSKRSHDYCYYLTEADGSFRIEKAECKNADLYKTNSYFSEKELLDLHQYDDFPFSVKLEFMHSEDGENLSNVEIKDLQTNAHIKLFIKDKRIISQNEYDEFENIRDRERAKYEDGRNVFIPSEFSVFNDTALDGIFNELFSDIDIVPLLGYNKYSVHGDRGWKDESLENEYGMLADRLRSDLKRYGNEVLQSNPDWLLLSDDEKKEAYSRVLLFFYRFYKIIPQRLSALLDSSYIPTTRQRPKHRYFLSNNRFDEKDYYGYLKMIDETNDFAPDLNAVLNRYLEEWGLAKAIVIEKSHNIGEVFLLSMTGGRCNMAETSSGIIQMLPIIIESFLCDPDCRNYSVYREKYQNRDLVIIEQPELHLHPKLQTDLIEDLADERVRYLIETHSEHMIRKIQLMVAQGKLSNKNVSVYFFEKKQSTNTHRMEMNERGLFDKDWPGGFFDDSVNLTLELFESLRLRSQNN